MWECPAKLRYFASEMVHFNTPPEKPSFNFTSIFNSRVTDRLERQPC